MINVSETAASKISELLVEEQKAGGGLRVFVQGGGCSGFQYGMMIEENGQGAGDQVFESHGIKLFVDPISIQYLKNAEVDFVDTITGGGFTIKNPNATSTCGCGSSFSTDYGHDDCFCCGSAFLDTGRLRSTTLDHARHRGSRRPSIAITRCAP